jgi:hypothetical protein
MSVSAVKSEARDHQLGKKSSKRTLLNLLSRPQGSARRFRPRALLILERRTTRCRRGGRDTPSIANSPARFGGSLIVSSIGSFYRPRRTTVIRIFRRYSKSSTRIVSIGAIVEAPFFPGTLAVAQIFIPFLLEAHIQARVIRQNGPIAHSSASGSCACQAPGLKRKRK